MDQKKIGAFLKELRGEKQLTQEQLADMLGVTNRSVSRWENGVNMPDFDLVMELAKFYEIGIEEILDGERKNEMVDKNTEQVLWKVADYESNEKKLFSRRICGLFMAAILAFIIYSVMNVTGLDRQSGYDQIASFALGVVGGTLLVGALYTSGYLAKIKAFKKRLLYKSGLVSGNGEHDNGKKESRIVLCIVLYVAAMIFGIAAVCGRTSAYSAAISCFCAATVITVQQRRKHK